MKSKTCKRISNSPLKITESVLRQAHKLSIFNREVLLKSDLCACFCCNNIFKVSEINLWADEDESTGICPYCMCDSLIGDATGLPLIPEFIIPMHKFWFGDLEPVDRMGNGSKHDIVTIVID